MSKINRLKEYQHLDKLGKVMLTGNVDDDIFCSVCHKGSLDDWDENYWCMIEQLNMELECIKQ